IRTVPLDPNAELFFQQSNLPGTVFHFSEFDASRRGVEKSAFHVAEPAAVVKPGGQDFALQFLLVVLKAHHEYAALPEHVLAGYGSADCQRQALRHSPGALAGTPWSG